MNRNVLNWLTGEVSEARHALILTHNISFLFVQSILLPKLRAAGNPRVTIFADGACAAGAWRQERSLVSGLGVQYRVVPVDLGPWRRFHPKALLLADQTGAALAIGSGNLTHGGMGANREAWVFSTNHDDGAPRIAALRDYLMGLMDLLPLSEPLREAIDAIFDADHPWVPALPPPGGLVAAPSDRPILERLATEAGSMRSATILAPYYDDRGEALRECARRFSAPVTALLQPGRAGLWAGAAKGLPAGVRLKSIQDPGEKPPFIHAKLIALDRGDDVLLAVGSANCSRAALMAGPNEGNAELMAWEIVRPDAIDSLLAEFNISDEAPELPEVRPSVEWADEARGSLRILAARQEAGELQIAFSSDAAIRELTVLGEGVWPVRELDAARSLVRLSVPVRLRTVALRATMADGTVESPEAWVDDEASLSAPATLRRVFKGLTDAEAGGSDAARKYEAVLEVFSEYLRDPEAARRRLRRKDQDSPPSTYDPAAVFDEGFGHVAMPSHGALGGALAAPSALSIIEMLFNFSRDGGMRSPSATKQQDDPEAEEAPEAEVLDSELTPDQRPEPDARLSAAVARAVARIEKALLEPGFVSGRSPALLSADLGLAATILVMGLASRHLGVETFRETTRRLWGALFFGDAGHPGAIPARVAAEQDPDAFMAEFANPRLAAALSLWCSTEWAAADREAAWFRLSAAALQSNWPALFAAAEPETIIAALRDIAGALLPINEQMACARTWRDVVRAGKALELLCSALRKGPPAAFQRVPRTAWIEPTELVWAGGAGGKLGFPTARMRHDASANVPVRPLGAARDTKFKGAFVFTVRALLVANVLELPSVAMPEIVRLVQAFEAEGRVHA